MTEAEWLSAIDPTPMLEYLQRKASDRKLRLFACACTRAVWELLADERARRAVQMAERYADGLATEGELSAASAEAWDAVDAYGSEANHAACTTVESYAFAAAQDAAGSASQDSDNVSAALRAQCTLLRDIFGNPFRLVTIDSSWRTPQVVTLAQAIYDGRAFRRMPELAAVLRECGCNDAAMLTHCEQPAEHVPGCWVVDLVLGETQLPMPGRALDLGQRRRLRGLFP
jgi:hypothetical protein